MSLNAGDQFRDLAVTGGVKGGGVSSNGDDLQQLMILVPPDDFLVRSDQWRICFRWEAGSVCDVEITDYH